ncbi:NupC/NupG family nucleoside CNT transporter [bacterium (Candidatus Blackallbacteria) CG17_big_fil_post_rev_8_21_14_2_50_48_46]|uniref:NupC/NupG family nucleoside CNT transporter n=1 Tax=bacterium (Candidatus Blackallbacteria) CG17_big_fil_post_rev_8_21_14_2_50_48_46 TaxID=2014261 RepID=A0A2M7G369_9BACT|nr:MAG: NupC/NupG family nucleoside CNT transporter [bacterium (Candidatus Blackallbacteria) CG18_big_fil_WC_8_21_14_2_50_49_26]PIW16125.1 MAG: NupC/NupG family nucleoside CNT transporter [bacterium (Candidatus Blackallbacteria) CG17_big_fil_post_rev_8_21_14_2_50_48_46]PIW45774.1 MAG: NupC/NupG family nucleoside CNT transporter [bacterium (Candidatus Blackallbacteria) CG13_big_fil_rev_8_21_14_2_50_49_14]
MEKFIGIIGLLVMFGIAFGLCKREDWKYINLRVVIGGTLMQLLFAFLILKTPVSKIFDWANIAVNELLNFTNKGSGFIFGNLINAGNENIGFIFAFQVLPTIIFFSSLMTVFYYLGVMQFIVNIIAKAMVKTLKTSGSETLSAAANIFVGQTEAPLVIKPFVEKMTNSELMAIMVGGMATVAGGVMASYVGLLRASIPDIAGHLMAASVMSAPAALVMAKIMIPEKETSETAGEDVSLAVERVDANIIDAAARGAGEGLTLALNVGAMLLAFIALIAMVNAGVGWLGSLAGIQALSLEKIFGWVFSPLAFLMGVPWADAQTIGALLGEKTMINEFVAYSHLAEMLKSGSGIELQKRSAVIATYALCGFSNLSSIAIQIGGIGGIAPSRRGDLARLGIRAVIAGSLACFMTATIAGMLI